MATEVKTESVMDAPADTVTKLEHDAREHGGPYESPPEAKDAIGRTMFDMPSSKDGTVTVLMPSDRLDDLPGQSLVRIVSQRDKRIYVGAVVEGPFTEPDGLRADSTPMVVSATKGHTFLPPFHGRAQVEIIGELDEDDEMASPRRRPSPNSPVFAMGVDEMSDHLGLAGNVRVGLAEGFDDMVVRTDSTRKDLIPRHMAILGTTGGGKSTTVSGLVSRVAVEGVAVVMIDTEGEYCAINEATSDSRMLKALKKRGLKPEGIKDTRIFHLVGRETRAEGHPSVAQFSLQFSSFSKFTVIEILGLSDAQEHRFLKAYDITQVVLNRLGITNASAAMEIDEFSEGYPGMKLVHLCEIIDQIIAHVKGDPPPTPRDSQFKARHTEITQIIHGAGAIEKSIPSWLALKSKLWKLLRLNIFDNSKAPQLPCAEMLKPGRVSILDLSDTDSTVVNNLVISDLLRCLQVAQDEKYAKAQELKAAGKGDGRPAPAMVVIEEAHEFLSRERADKMENLFAQVARISRRGRKRWLGLCFVTQLPQHLPDEVFGLVNNFVLHKISDSNVVSRMRRTVGNVPDGMWGRLPSLASGQALVSLATLTRPLFVNVDPTPCRLLMTD